MTGRTGSDAAGSAFILGFGLGSGFSFSLNFGFGLGSGFSLNFGFSLDFGLGRRSRLLFLFALAAALQRLLARQVFFRLNRRLAPAGEAGGAEETRYAVDGSAPTPSQCRTRSSFRTTRSGWSFGSIGL